MHSLLLLWYGMGFYIPFLAHIEQEPAYGQKLITFIFSRRVPPNDLWSCKYSLSAKTPNYPQATLGFTNRPQTRGIIIYGSQSVWRSTTSQSAALTIASLVTRSNRHPPMTLGHRKLHNPGQSRQSSKSMTAKENETYIAQHPSPRLYSGNAPRR